MYPRGPEFKRYSRVLPLPVKPVLYRANYLELEVLSGSVIEVYTVLGTEDSMVYLRAKVANRGSVPLTVGMKTLSAFVPDVSFDVTAYITDDVVLQPGGQAEVKIGIRAGVAPGSRPLALRYAYSPFRYGPEYLAYVRMELEYY
jgi:hypothetical protein